MSNLGTGRCTKAARIRRVDVVYRLLLRGLDTPEIVEEIATEHAEWGVKRRAIQYYISAAKELLIEAGETLRPVELGRSVARRHDLYAKAYGDGDYRTANAVQKELDEVLGLKEPAKIEVTEILNLMDHVIDRKRREVERMERESGDDGSPDDAA